METCGSLSLLKSYPKSQQWPIPFIQAPTFSSSSSINSNPRRRTQIRLGFDSGKNDINNGKQGKYFENIKDRFKRRRWWSEKDSTPPDQPPPGILDQIIESSFILKVLSAYGWGLPIILISLLIASGPKAFLMSMVFPIGESTLNLTFKKMSSLLSSSSSPASTKRKKKRKNPNLKEEDEMGDEEEEVSGQGKNPSNFGGWG
ncbi:uncharacterized protein LOC124936286 [Impatiens glandulifera]|uniref:uncharacterized protein LOC124936286 n=1 Tax=Impatiens glandulifera TaxID=253017 RepID=UPI001FB087D9|nr:uncharacterized protein LOC124936286 [Impatiens glandulifera]